jgi:hypothetical protein
MRRADHAATRLSLGRLAEVIDGSDRVPAALAGARDFLMQVYIPAGQAACEIRAKRLRDAVPLLDAAGRVLDASHRLTAAGGCYCLSPKSTFTLSEAEYQNLRAGIADARAMSAPGARP